LSQKILICDDTPTVLDFLELVFEKQSFEVIRAGSGKYAIEMAVEHQPDLLLVDAMMPGMDGFEVCRRLRANPATASETILMYSAIVGEEVRARALSAGADEFLGKTLSHAELVSQVRDWLAARSAPGGVGRPEWVRVGMDLLVLFRSELVWLAEAVPNGVATLAVASERGEQQALRFAHKLGPGSSGSAVEGFLAKMLSQAEPLIGEEVDTERPPEGGEAIMAALEDVGVASFGAVPLNGSNGRQALLLFASPTTLTLDRRAAAEIAVGVRYAEAVLAHSGSVSYDL
jgi:DNA-binding response OmpR family regulator